MRDSLIPKYLDEYSSTCFKFNSKIDLKSKAWANSKKTQETRENQWWMRFPPTTLTFVRFQFIVFANAEWVVNDESVYLISLKLKY